MQKKNLDKVTGHSELGARARKQQDQRQQWREEIKNSVRLNAEDNSSRTGARWHT